MMTRSEMGKLLRACGWTACSDTGTTLWTDPKNRGGEKKPTEEAYQHEMNRRLWAKEEKLNKGLAALPKEYILGVPEAKATLYDAVKAVVEDSITEGLKEAGLPDTQENRRECARRIGQEMAKQRAVTDATARQNAINNQQRMAAAGRRAAGTKGRA